MIQGRQVLMVPLIYTGFSQCHIISQWPQEETHKVCKAFMERNLGRYFGTVEMKIVTWQPIVAINEFSLLLFTFILEHNSNSKFRGFDRSTRPIWGTKYRDLMKLKWRIYSNVWEGFLRVSKRSFFNFLKRCHWPVSIWDHDTWHKRQLVQKPGNRICGPDSSRNTIGVAWYRILVVYTTYPACPAW